MKSVNRFTSTCAFLILVSLLCFGQASTPADDAQELVKQGRKLNSDGKQDEALKLYAQVLQKSPNSYDAQLESGIALDLKGNYTEAREHLKKAIDAAAGPDQKNRAMRVMAVSYAFEKNAAEAEKYEKPVFDQLAGKPDYEAAAGVANELARIMLESGDSKGAAKWYKIGYDTALRKADLKDADKALWEFRWENAQARVAARRGKKDEANRHVALAKVAFDKANNPQQAEYWPYLAGYVAFYGGDYKTSIAELTKANQSDPFILILLAWSYEKSGEAPKAKELYQKIMTINTHNPPNAFARPEARSKLESSK